MSIKMSCSATQKKTEILAKIKRFATREDGSIVILSLFLVPMMLILGGMAVDFMRYEGRRAVIQDTADRAALAAANLQYTDSGNAVDVVDDFFTKAGLEQYLVAPANVSDTFNARTVAVNVRQPLGTFFLRLIGIDELDAIANSVATQAADNVEISLVLDISGSMNNPTFDADGNNTGQTKIQALAVAATTFVNTALQDSNRDKVSISLVPYSEHVNIGSDLFNGLTTNKVHDYSYCIDFEDADFSSASIDLGRAYTQAPHFDWHTVSGSPDRPNCMNESFQTVTAFSQDRTALINQIGQFEGTTRTSTFLGVKWGLALLDPSMRTVVAPVADAAFNGRPAAFSDTQTRKVLIVMADGQNTNSQRIKPEFYQDEDDYDFWATTPVKEYLESEGLDRIADRDVVLDREYESDEGDQLLSNACQAAKDENVQVFAIAFESSAEGQAAMADCATSSNHYFNTNGADLEAVFLSIAEQFTDLRLTQ